MVQFAASYAHVEIILNCTKLNDHQVDTASQGYWQDCTKTTKWKTQRHKANEDAISASCTYITYSSLWWHLQRLALDMSSVVTLYVVDYDSVVSGPIDHSDG